MKHADPSEFAPLDQISDLSAEEYFCLLHPEGSRGRAAVLCKQGDDEVENYSLEHAGMVMQMPLFLDQTSFLTLNRFWKGRQGRHLAALNSLYVDLDYFDAPPWRGKSPDEVQAAYSAHLLVSGMPQPSIFIHTGRGLAAIWLIEQTPVSALPRWQGAMRALIEFSTSFGADKVCGDATRVFRIPGTINEKSSKEVRISGGTGRRYGFDALADQIFRASGRPTREELEERKKQKKGKKRPGGISVPKGLPQAKRFKLILDDLEVFRNAHGGVIPTGLRNNWLHFHATCLTHIPGIRDIEGEVLKMAATATPGLKPGEVNAIARQAVKKARSVRTFSVWNDGRYHYKGATIAEGLDITPEMARSLGLQQVIPDSERRRRKAEAERRRRSENGAVSREEYLAKHNASREKPWEKLGIGRTKYYELKRAGMLPVLEAA
ncbi:hypothetical protein [Shimia sp. R9_3]|uniref:hypothetical protein n=1 Tax=Shimia sp. R9_3 TaxID=2821113 RepID=UPI001ADA3D71|nr:hypothetical protein [Shimia sp. R9_3]MBO9400846.1 hypothetical protein [Shimia sp. R9_3]